MDKVRKVHFCNFRGRMGDARKLLVFGAAVVLTAAATGLADVAEAQSAGGGVITAAQVFRQMLVQEEEAIAREAKERAEESEDMRRHRNRDGGSRPPQRLRDVPIEDWLATEEGRFAHSIRIPNPVPEDSGYRPGMSQQEYFEHLCKNEAGEFIFKTADNVEGLYQMRPRRIYTDQEWRHLYALEDPYGYWKGEHESLGQPYSIVRPNLYVFLEIPVAHRLKYSVDWRIRIDPSMTLEPPGNARLARYFGEGEERTNWMRLRYDTERRARYGYTWRGIKRPMDRELGIAGGELIVLDLQTMDVMGVRRGFNIWNRSWTNRVCPRYGYHGGEDRGSGFTTWFVARVARPSTANVYFESLEKFRRSTR